MEAEKLPRKEREKASHRSQILAEALELFKEKGYHNVSMHEIAAKAEFSIGTLYKYFINKEDLYSALMIEKGEAVSRIIDEVLSRKDDIENMVKNYIDVKIKIFLENLDFVRLLIVETQMEKSFSIKTSFGEVLRELHQQEMSKVAALLEKGIRSKQFRKLNPHHLSVALGGLIDGFMFNWLENSGSHPYEADASFISELFFNGCLVAKKPVRRVD
jgi:TetR/AcrR family transcriptional regulator